MSGKALDSVLLPNGVERIPGGSRDADPETEAADAVIDLVICIRGAEPNVHLGMTDRFIVAGEWGLALEEIEAVIAPETGKTDEWVKAAFERADKALPKKTNGDRS